MNSYIEKIGQEHLEEIATQIQGMSPVEKVCARGTIELATVIAVLINAHEWQAVESFAASCTDLFSQAAEIDKYLRSHEHEGRMPTVKQARKYGKTKRWRKQ